MAIIPLRQEQLGRARSVHEEMMLNTMRITDAGGRALLQEIADVLSQAKVVLPDGVPNKRAAQERLSAGLPALTDEPVVDAKTLRETLLTLTAKVSQHAGAPGERGRAIAYALQKGHPNWEQAARVFHSGDLEALTSALPVPDGSQSALLALADWASWPMYRAAADRIATLISATHWGLGSCPGCGNPPVLAELRAGNEGGRTLRCLRCLSAWGFPVLTCVHCGARDHSQLSYAHAEGEDATRRVQICDVCHGYLKEVAVLSPLGGGELMERDLATADLDLVAQREGGRR